MTTTIYVTSSQYTELVSPYASQSNFIYYNIDTQFQPDNTSTLYETPIYIYENTRINYIHYNIIDSIYSLPQTAIFIRLLQQPTIYIADGIQYICNVQFENFEYSDYKPFVIYTTDGSTPSLQNGTVTDKYIFPVRELLDGHTPKYDPIKVVCVQNNSIDSNIVISKLPTPTINYESGIYYTSILLQIFQNILITDQVSIYYTTDSSYPSSEYGTLYEGPILLQQFNTYTIKAIASCST